MHRRQPPALSTYVQAAIDASLPSAANVPRQRHKQEQPNALIPRPLPPSSPPAPVLRKTKRRKRQSKLHKSMPLNPKVLPKYKFRVRGLVTAAELKDEDQAIEVCEGIRAKFARFGELRAITVSGRYEKDQEQLKNSDLIGDVIVAFKDATNAASAFHATNGKVIMGKIRTCTWEPQNDVATNFNVVVKGILTPEEVNDPDERADVTEEMRVLFMKHANVKALQLSDQTGDVTVTLKTPCDAKKVVQAVNGLRYGGRDVVARLEFKHASGNEWNHDALEVLEVETTRVASPIVQPIETPEVQELVGLLLKRLASLQERAHGRKKASKRSRRFVLGMHEVRRGLLCHKIVLLVIATDFDRLEAVEDQCAELVATARELQVPLLAPMNRRKLGSVVHKKVRVSCVGIYSVDGANDLFQRILQTIVSST